MVNDKSYNTKTIILATGVNFGNVIKGKIYYLGKGVGVKLKNGEIKCDGIFVMKDIIPPDQLVPGLLVEEHPIKTNRLMKTNLNGCFAAGDYFGKSYQYLKSAGEGQIAALSAVSYLNSIR